MCKWLIWFLRESWYNQNQNKPQGKRICVLYDIQYSFLESFTFMIWLTLTFIMLSVVDTYPELFQREIFSLVDAVVVDKYYLLSLTPESTVGMEVTSRLWHETVYGILLSNTTDDLVNCALDIVHKKRVELLTALHFQLNALQVSIGHIANEMHIH